MKKAILVSLAIAGLTACQSPGLQTLNNSFQGRTAFRAQTTASSDWFQALPPQLQHYYAPAQGKTGRALFEALHQIISKDNQFDSYGRSKSYIYSVADNGPWGPNGQMGLIASYSDVFVPGKSGSGGSYRERGDANRDGRGGDFINCEHTWPQSFFNKREPMRSDMHHLFATFSQPNGRRSHYAFGTESEGSVIYSTANGSKLVERGRLSFSTAPGVAHNTDAVFEPANTQKGNTARATLYFYLRWHKAGIRSGHYNADEFWNSRLDIFKNWAENIDPVDDRERRRNDLIQKKQGNRNPFVDIPNLTSLIGVDTLRASESRFR